MWIRGEQLLADHAATLPISFWVNSTRENSSDMESVCVLCIFLLNKKRLTLTILLIIIILTRTASSYERGPSPPARRRAHRSWPKGWWLGAKVKTQANIWAVVFAVMGSVPEEQKAECVLIWICCSKPRPHWPVMTTFKIWPQDWTYIIPTKFSKNRCSRSRVINFPSFLHFLVAKIAKFSSSLPSVMSINELKFGVISI